MATNEVRKREPNECVEYPMREGLSDCRRNWSKYIRRKSLEFVETLEFRGIGSLSRHKLHLSKVLQIVYVYPTERSLGSAK